MTITERLIEFFKHNLQNGELSGWLISEFDQDVEIEEVEDEVIDERRWINIHDVVYSIPSEHSFIRIREGHGSTEYQEHDGVYSVEQVYPQQVTVTKYVTKENIRAK